MGGIQLEHLYLRNAITREVSRSIIHCELTHLDRQTIDLDRARRQHGDYEARLEEMGCRIIRLPEETDLPDSVFVEDTAIVLDEVAVVLRPGADSRKPETASVENALKEYRKLIYITEPGTIDGGDVLRIGRTLYVGLSSRTNRPAVDQLQKMLAPFDYTVKEVEVQGCLHLKTAITQVGENAVLFNPNWVDGHSFKGMGLIAVDSEEPFAANTVWIDPFVLFPTSFPKTAERLERMGYRLKLTDASELAKAEGALTCCSIIFDERPAGKN